MPSDVNLFETVRERFGMIHPFSLISNVILYRNDRKDNDLYANEIDHLFHYKNNDGDHLVIIEVKQRKLYGESPGISPTDNSPWMVDYGDQPKNIKRQVRNQAIALNQFCYNVSQTEPLVECWVVDLRAGSQHIITDKWDKRLSLLTLTGFGHKLDQIETVIKVEHSGFLRELRRGIVAPDLGHPEVANAIRFIRTCRKSLDDQAYRFFRPRPSRYAINGCAGMGKSVLLAYSLFVLASDYAISFNDGSRLVLEPSKLNLGLPAVEDRKIYVYAVKQKQIEALRAFWQRTIAQLSRIADRLPVMRPPVFGQWVGNIPSDCSILAVDESHDLSIADQERIRNWLYEASDKELDRYLIVACDRNQALKRRDSGEEIVAGLNFSRHTTRLNRIYRCPFPVYVSSIGLLFRWFAPQGANVVLSTQKLRECFGFRPRVKELDESMVLTMRNDSHPGNNWQQTVNRFDDCTTAYTHLSQFSLERGDVLWACFERREADFDYTRIQRDFTFVDLKGEYAENEIDLHVKGQEFAIVVVEGLPVDMNPPELADRSDWGDSISVEELRMWRSRRNIYVVCSRASAFLYFVLDTEHAADPNTTELRNLITQVSSPSRSRNESGQTWEFEVRKPVTRRKPLLFRDVENLVDQDTDPRETEGDIVEYDGVLSVPGLAKAFGVLQQEIQDLLPKEAKAKYNSDITVLPQHAEAVAKGLKSRLRRVDRRSIGEYSEPNVSPELLRSPQDRDASLSSSLRRVPQYVEGTDRQHASGREVAEEKQTSNRLPFTGNYINRRITHATLFGSTEPLSTWKELLLLVAERVCGRHPDTFQKCLSLQGTKMKYFSVDRADLEQPKRIGSSSYYAETKLNANSIVRRCRDLLSLFGYGDRDLDIYVL